jgi:exodeoxyribonuclease VII small subunit
MSGGADETAVTDFESDLEALESKVQTLQRGTVSLDEALRTFEEGVALYRRCSAALRTAEQRVAKLVVGLDGLEEVPLATEE